MTRLTAQAAIDYAEQHNLTLSKFADPTENARTGLSVEEALGVASEDPGLIYLDIDATADDLVLCESPDGWSLHAPGSADEDIASGDAPYLVSGEGKPTAADYAEALAKL